MATQESGQSDSSRGGSGFLYFVVGALVVAVGVLGFMYYAGQSRSESVAERSADRIGDAAKDLGDAAKDAARNVAPPPGPAPKPVQPVSPTVLPPS